MDPANFWAFKASKLFSMAILRFSRKFYITYKFAVVIEGFCFKDKWQS